MSCTLYNRAVVLVIGVGMTPFVFHQPREPKWSVLVTMIHLVRITQHKQRHLFSVFFSSFFFFFCAIFIPLNVYRLNVNCKRILEMYGQIPYMFMEVLK